MVSLLAQLGRHGQWVLPLGLLAGMLLPQAAGPLRSLIPVFIAILLFLAVLRILPRAGELETPSSTSSGARLLWRVLLAQLLLPLSLFGVLSLLQAPMVVILAATLVAAAPPISGSPNLVLLLRGDGSLALRWLILATVLLPLSCMPVLHLLQPGQSITTMLMPSLKLLLLIGSAVLLGVLVSAACRRHAVSLNSEAIDGMAALALALMVVGLMSALHDPLNGWADTLAMLLLAFAINVGLQWLGLLVARASGRDVADCVCTGVVSGNRNIALFLAVLPAVQMESLLLFIACYQIPMYLTPLIGGLFYGRLE